MDDSQAEDSTGDRVDQQLQARLYQVSTLMQPLCSSLVQAIAWTCLDAQESQLTYAVTNHPYTTVCQRRPKSMRLHPFHSQCSFMPKNFAAFCAFHAALRDNARFRACMAVCNFQCIWLLDRWISSAPAIQPWPVKLAAWLTNNHRQQPVFHDD